VIDNKQRLAYIVATAGLVMVMAGSGAADLIGAEAAVAIITHLGYPDYFPHLLGVAKLLGVAALVAPVPRTLREWAYAGFTFDLLAAMASHLIVGDPLLRLGLPLVLLVLLFVSYGLWRKRSAASTSGPDSLRPATEAAG
jgi:hypothetical protein